MVHRWLLFALAWIAGMAVSKPGAAQQPPASAEPRDLLPPGPADSSTASAGSDPDAEPPEQQAEPEGMRRVNFTAGRVDLDPRLSELRMADGVVVQVDRYRLTSDRLVLRRGPRGVEVEGEGRVAFCPCPNPPVTIGFDAATVAPPTDLLIEDPTLRIGGVPVFWAPYLWLRSPERAGMLPPRIAWRGDDGLLMGTGVHLPLGPSRLARERSTLRLRGSGYLQGGAVAQVGLDTPQSTTYVSWDHLKQSLVEIDSHGSLARADGSADAAWRVDAIRGPRAARGTVSLEAAARRYDRAEATVAHHSSGLVAGLGVRADDWRARGLRRLGAAGPRGHLGYASALDGVGTTDASLTLMTVQDPRQGASTVALHRHTLGIDLHPGPLVAGAELVHQAAVASTEYDAGATLVSQGNLRLGLPLVRAYGRRSDPLLHSVEPLVLVGARHAASLGPPLEFGRPGDGVLLSAVAGARTALGRFGSREAGSLRVVGGWIGGSTRMRPSLGVRASARSSVLELRGEAVWQRLPEHALVSLVRARLGSRESVNLAGYLQGRLRAEPPTARWLAPDPAHAPAVGWLAPASAARDDGWSAGTALGVPWTRWLASSVTVDQDLTAARLLGVGGSVGYRHPCGCIALIGTVGHRFGRPGVDASVVADLLP